MSSLLLAQARPMMMNHLTSIDLDLQIQFNYVHAVFVAIACIIIFSRVNDSRHPSRIEYSPVTACMAPIYKNPSLWIRKK